MRFSSLVASALSLFVVSVSAANHLVLVGDNSTLTFNPSSIQVNDGDTVSFEFRSKNHSVTQSTFANPCTQMTTPTLGVDSGFQATPNDTTTFASWTITISNSSAPLWFFCAQTIPKNHCQTGMVFAINPSAAKSFAAYQQNAINSASAAGGAAPGGTSSTSAVPVGSTSTTSAGNVGQTVATGGATLVTSFGSVGTAPTAAVGLPTAATNSSGTTGTNSAATLKLGSGATALFLASLIAGLIL